MVTRWKMKRAQDAAEKSGITSPAWSSPIINSTFPTGMGQCKFNPSKGVPLWRTGPGVKFLPAEPQFSLEGWEGFSPFINFVQVINQPHLPLCWTQQNWWLRRKMSDSWPEWAAGRAGVTHPPTIKHLSCHGRLSNQLQPVIPAHSPASLPQKGLMEPIKQK